MIGVPLGRNLLSGATLCADPISWFQRAKLISNPSCFVLGKPGLGKTHARAPHGARPGRLRRRCRWSSATSSPTTSTSSRRSAARSSRSAAAAATSTSSTPARRPRPPRACTGTRAPELLADARGRRHTMVCALITILRNAPPTDREETILDRAVRVLDERHGGIPVLQDLIAGHRGRARRGPRGRAGPRRHDALPRHHREPAGHAEGPAGQRPRGGDVLPADDDADAPRRPGGLRRVVDPRLRERRCRARR